MGSAGSALLRDRVFLRGAITGSSCFMPRSINPIPLLFVPECADIIPSLRITLKSAIHGGTKLMGVHWIGDRPIPIPQAPRLVGSSGVANPGYALIFLRERHRCRLVSGLRAGNKDRPTTLKAAGREEISYGTLYVVVAAGCS